MIPHIKEAREVEGAIVSVIPDIRLFWNGGLQRWVVAQIKENPGGLVLPGLGDMPSATRPFTLYVIRVPKTGAYRAPSQLDVQMAIKIGRNGREAIEKGAAWLMKQVEDQETANKAVADKRLRDTVEAIAPDMRRAMRNQKSHRVGRKS